MSKKPKLPSSTEQARFRAGLLEHRQGAPDAERFTHNALRDIYVATDLMLTPEDLERFMAGEPLETFVPRKPGAVSGASTPSRLGGRSVGWWAGLACLVAVLGVAAWFALKSKQVSPVVADMASASPAKIIEPPRQFTPEQMHILDVLRRKYEVSDLVWDAIEATLQSDEVAEAFMNLRRNPNHPILKMPIDQLKAYNDRLASRSKRLMPALGEYLTLNEEWDACLKLTWPFDEATHAMALAIQSNQVRDPNRLVEGNGEQIKNSVMSRRAAVDQLFHRITGRWIGE